MTARMLVAGIGNIFLGDDAFGVAVVEQLSRRDLPPEARIVDFGIRGLDLAYALLDDYEFVLFIDAMPRGGPPGTVYVIEPELHQAGANDPPPTIEMHHMDPVRVLRLAEAMGARIDSVVVIGCEPSACDSEDMQMGMTAAVQAAVAEAADMAELVIRRVLDASPARQSDRSFADLISGKAS